MNIFYLDPHPATAAQQCCDKHVVKMILESAQMLSTAHRVLDKNDNELLYKEAHKNHPSTKWVREGVLNYQWLYAHFVALGEEYTARYGKVHVSITKLKNFLKSPPKHIPNKLFSEPPQCMPDVYKQKSSVDAYRSYYKGEKADFATWKEPTVVPSWWENTWPYDKKSLDNV